MTHEYSRPLEVVIVGRGSVGLFLGCLLCNSRISCKVLERRTEPVTDCRSVGIHPVSLELFEGLGMARSMLEEGIPIQRGRAFADQTLVGILSFESCPRPFNFVLALPQFRTEALLERHLLELDGDALLREAEVVDLKEHATGVEMQIESARSVLKLQAKYLIGCDGKYSIARRKSGIRFPGGLVPACLPDGRFLRLHRIEK